MEVTAIEEAFLRGEWGVALVNSKQILTQHVIEVLTCVWTYVCQLAAENGKNEINILTSDEERVLSVYLQSIFELEQHGEVETASAIVQFFHPLPFDVAMQWVKFLIAMDQRAIALNELNATIARYRASFSSQPTEQLKNEYQTILNVLVFQVLLPSESLTMVQDCIQSDEVLDEESKQRLLRYVEEYTDRQQAARNSLPVQASNANASASKQSAATNNHAAYQDKCSTATHVKQTQEEEDLSSTYIMIGGTAIGLAFAAMGLFRYKDKIHESMTEVLPAISKSLSDAKYALFEA